MARVVLFLAHSLSVREEYYLKIAAAAIQAGAMANTATRYCRSICALPPKAFSASIVMSACANSGHFITRQRAGLCFEDVPVASEKIPPCFAQSLELVVPFLEVISGNVVLPRHKISNNLHQFLTVADPFTPLRAVPVLRRTIQKAGTALIKRQPISCPTAPCSLP